jgi:hypothetical protein
MMAPRQGVGLEPPPAHAASWRGRSLHVIDVENLVGSGRPDEASVADLRRLYIEAVGVRPLDHLIVACARSNFLNVAFGWGTAGTRFRVGVGRDAADRELIDVLECEQVQWRFRSVHIASGDGILAPAAAHLGALGCVVTVVSWRTSLSARLRLAATRNICLDHYVAPRCCGKPPGTAAAADAGSSSQARHVAGVQHA